MTHYWWMHWFWITNVVYLFYCESILHSNTTKTTPLSTNNSPTPSMRLPNESLQITLQPKVQVDLKSKAINASDTKFDALKPMKPFQKKINFTNKLKNMSKNETKNEDKVESVKTPIDEVEFYNMTVINQKNVTDNHVLDTNTSAIIHTDNTTYLENINFNQSSLIAANSERIGREDKKINYPGTLSAAGITGITLGCVIIFGIVCGISYFFYNNRGFNRPQVLTDRYSNPDSSGYIDDASVRDNSEEMYSLDNDSFLNSLEAMTIQNYWTDTVKHTKL